MNDRDLGLHILDENGNPVKTGDYLAWSKWHRNFANRVIAETFVNNIRISTVFLGLNHSLQNEPQNNEHFLILYETMVFGGERDQEQWRWATKLEALNGHEELVAELKMNT